MKTVDELKKQILKAAYEKYKQTGKASFTFDFMNSNPDDPHWQIKSNRALDELEQKGLVEKTHRALGMAMVILSDYGIRFASNL